MIYVKKDPKDNGFKVNMEAQKGRESDIVEEFQAVLASMKQVMQEMAPNNDETSATATLMHICAKVLYAGQDLNLIFQKVEQMEE